MPLLPIVWWKIMFFKANVGMTGFTHVKAVIGISGKTGGAVFHPDQVAARD